MTYYVVYIFDMAGLTGNIGLISSGIQYAIFIIGTAATFFFIDVTGRRPLLIYGALAMAVCMFVVGGVLGSYGKRFLSCLRSLHGPYTVWLDKSMLRTKISTNFSNGD